MAEMENEFMKRGYLLPEGCKDLIDAAKPTIRRRPKLSPPAPLPPVVGDLTVPAQMTAIELATALGRKPFQIIADLLGIGIYASTKELLDFETVAKVVRRYGFIAKKAI